jgi:hypothetical protein
MELSMKPSVTSVQRSLPVESEAASDLAIEAGLVGAANAAAREERRGDWFQRSWRALDGHVLALVVAGSGLAVGAAAIRGVLLLDSGALNVLTALLDGVGNRMLFLTASGAIVGVTAWTRGRDNEARLTGVAPPSLAAQMVQVFAKGRPS